MPRNQPLKPISCFICFGEDSLLESNSLNECSCRFFVHEACWKQAKHIQIHQDQCIFCNKKTSMPRPSAPPATTYEHLAIPFEIPISHNYQSIVRNPTSIPTRNRGMTFEQKWGIQGILMVVLGIGIPILAFVIVIFFT
jgi:hypothetical protein